MTGHDGHDGIHFLDVRFGRRVICKGGPDAPCRSGCAEWCDASQYGDPCSHPKTAPIGYCYIAEWINDGDDCADLDHPLVPVVTRWDGDCCRWRIVDAA